MRVLHVVHGFPPECRGGTESLVKSVAEAQIQRGDLVAVLTGTLEVTATPTVSVSTTDSLTVFRLTKGGFDVDRWDRSDDLGAAAEIDKVFEAFVPDVIHVHHWIRLSRLIVRSAGARGVPVVLTLHDATATCPTAFRIRANSLCDKSPSGESCAGCAPTPPHLDAQQLNTALDIYADDLAQEVAAADVVAVPSLAHAKFITPWLPPGILPTVIANPPLAVHPLRRRATENGGGPLRLLTFGQLSFAKGTPLLYEAIRGLPPELRSRLQVTVKGLAIDTETRRVLDHLKQGMPIEETGEYTPDALTGDAFDVAVLPSVASESWSFTLDEAWAMGLPAVVPNRGALGERIGAAGFTFEPESSESLAGVLATLITNPSIIEAARSMIPAPLLMETHLKELDSAYERAIAAPRRVGALWRNVASKLASRLVGVEQSLERASGKLVGERARFDDLDAAFRGAEGSVETLRGEVGQLQSVIAAFQESVDAYQRENSLLHSEFEALKQERGTLEATLRARDESLIEFERSVVQYRDLVSRKEADLAAFQVSIEEHQRVLRDRSEAEEKARRETQATHAAIKVVLSELESRLGRATHEMSRQADGLAKELALSESNLSLVSHAADDRGKGLNWDSNAAAVEASGFANELESLQQHLDGLSAAAAVHRAVIVNLRALIETTVEREQGLTSRLAALANRLAVTDGEVRILEDRVRELLRARRVADDVIAHLTADLSNLRRVLTSEQLSHGALRKDVVALRANAVELTSSRDRAMARLARSEVSNQAALARCAELSGIATETSRRLRAATQGLVREQSAAESWRRRAQEAELGIATQSELMVNLEKRMVSLAAELAAAEREIESNQSDKARFASMLGAGSDESSDLSQVALGLRSDLDRLRGTLSDVTAALRGPVADLKKAQRALSIGDSVLRVLMVVHDFLPYHAAGSEVYTYQLAKALSAHCDVHLIFCENRPDRPQYETREGVFDGIPFTEVVHHDAYPTFGLTYEDPAMERVFDGILKRVKPDVVHVQHLKFWGVGIVERARLSGCPIIFTLHEYMLICPRDGQMRRPNGERCDVPVVSTCALCIEGKALEQGWIAQRAIAAGRFLSERLPDGARHVGTRVARRVASRYASAGSPTAREEAISRRLKRTNDAMRHVDLFLAPSQFLRDRFVASGMIPVDRIEWSRYGQDVSRFPQVEKVKSSHLRVGYLGTLSAYKGLGVLIEALESLSAYDIEGRIHGALEIFPDYVAHLRQSLVNQRIHFLGRFDNKDVARLLAEIDVLVVPSLWWENAPLTIHEAFLAGVPVVCSDIGGMRELVIHGRNGLHFAAGDAADLARTLLRLATDPALLRSLTPDQSEIRDIREDASTMMGRYRTALAKHGGNKLP